MKLMAYNILEGGESAEGRRLDLVATIVRTVRPDLLVLCEAHGFHESPRLLADFGAAVGMRGRTTGAVSGFHVALLVRIPLVLRAFESVDLGGLNPVAVAQVDVPRLGTVQVVGAHLDHRFGPARDNEARAIVGLLDPARPRAVLGDLNGLSHRDELGKADLLRLPLHHVSRHVDAHGELDTAAARVFAESGLVDAWAESRGDAHPAAGFTVPTAIPRPPRFGSMRIDYILLSQDLASRLVRCEVVREPPAPNASDHFPIVAEIAY